MKKHVLDELRDRGFMAQFTHENELKELMEKEQLTFYIGFDATADSLTAGHFLTIMAMAHLQKAGHRPIALLGGGTTLIGDPSFRNDMRKIMTIEDINYNANKFKEQLSRFLDFSEGKAILENNANWLLDLNYVEFLREIGIHFSVNKMLSADCYKSRITDNEKGLTFFELNYMLMQAYDFYVLYQKYNCKAQFGGNDQWSNMIAGEMLISKKLKKQAYAATFNLLTTSDGVKMGKTMKGAIWLDENKTSVYDFYQYFRNVDDKDTIKFMKLLTFMPLEEIKKYEEYKDEQLNIVKEIFAYEVTKIVHGEEKATIARNTAKSIFSGNLDVESMPYTEIDKSDINNILLVDLMLMSNLVKSKSEARRLIEQNGVKFNEIKVEDKDLTVNIDSFEKGYAIIQKGKKIFHKIIIK